MFQNYQHPNRVVPATVMVIVAAVLVIGCAYQVSDRFLEPQIKTTEQAKNSTTGKVAQRAGARLSPTAPGLSVEPEKPKTEQPADRPDPNLVPK